MTTLVTYLLPSALITQEQMQTLRPDLLCHI